MFEHKSEALLPRRAFLGRVARGVLWGTVLVLASLAVGMVGYHALEGLVWADAFLNAAMLLGGMGPVNPPLTLGGKLFAGFYALYCGLLVILVAGIVLAPVAHRILHRFHLEQRKGREE
jgi:hypothetical protein